MSRPPGARSGEPAAAVAAAPVPAPPLRSWLFVPGDSERKQEKALATDADALILDLEDSVAAAQLTVARERVAHVLHARRGGTGPQLWVRVNAPASGQLRADLAEVCAAGSLPDGVVLPKVSAADEIVDVAQYLATLEKGFGRAAGSTRLLVIATETPRGLLGLPQYAAALDGRPEVGARLAGLTWGAEDLSAALGAAARRDAAGALTFIFQLARATCLLASAALGVQAIDGVHTDFRDAPGLERELADARRDGFSGKLAIHPDQVAAINAAFAPTDAEREHARRVVAAFAASPGAGVASLDGQMIDRPHLLHAQRILAVKQHLRSGA
ncbi:MAG TPA: CoA ester lyase [Steroidobacteraceae bacterium]|nr:CoA ester lyase [Steroidobacteraceae bacterium]